MTEHMEVNKLRQIQDSPERTLYKGSRLNYGAHILRDPLFFAVHFWMMAENKIYCARGYVGGRAQREGGR